LEKGHKKGSKKNPVKENERKKSNRHGIRERRALRDRDKSRKKEGSNWSGLTVKKTIKKAKSGKGIHP